jgi:hypothetical protein
LDNPFGAFDIPVNDFFHGIAIGRFKRNRQNQQPGCQIRLGFGLSENQFQRTGLDLADRHLSLSLLDMPRRDP